MTADRFRTLTPATAQSAMHRRHRWVWADRVGTCKCGASYRMTDAGTFSAIQA